MTATVQTERHILENWFTTSSVMPSTGKSIKTVEDASCHVWAALSYRVVFNKEGRGFYAGNSGVSEFWIDINDQPVSGVYG